MNEIRGLKELELSPGFEKRVFEKIGAIRRRRMALTAAGLFLMGLISVALIRDVASQKRALVSSHQEAPVGSREKPVDFALEQIHLVSSNQNGSYLVEEMRDRNISNCEI